MYMYALGHLDLYIQILASIVISSYFLFWDIYMDTSLGRIKSKYFFLRDKIIFPKKFYYYAIIINTALRFIWLLSYVEIRVDEEVKVLTFSVLEIIRRTFWIMIRIENEYINNPEKYRNVLDIPELPLD
jgi:hypothetical protein